MATISTIKYLIGAAPISRVERIVSVGVVAGLNYLTKKAVERGDFHEANHNQMALLAGLSGHAENHVCAVPADRMLTPSEGHSLADQLSSPLAPEPAAIGLYL